VCSSDLVWVDFDGKYLIVDSEKGRQKDRNIKRDPRVAVEIADPDDPYRFLIVRGRVEEITESGADEVINRLALRYTGKPFAAFSPIHPRVVYKVKPLNVSTSTPSEQVTVKDKPITSRVPTRAQIKPGTRARIVQKQDQSTGRLTGGVVARILTSSPTHPHGIKVMLTDGKVGRVQSLE
jgi:uncharacterized repeat protein (TIGR03833 family)